MRYAGALAGIFSICTYGYFLSYGLMFWLKYVPIDSADANSPNKAAGTFAYATSENEAMHYMNEAQAVFRESGETGEKALAGAKMAAPFLAKMMAASSILSEESQAKLKHESMAMLRAVDLQGGGLSPEHFSKLADFGFRITQTSGGQINWEQLRQMFRTGGLSVQRMDEKALAELEPIIGEFKGSSFANAMRTAYNRMNGIIKLPNQATQELLRAGLWDRSKVVLNSNGGIKTFLGNPLRHADEYSANAAEYYFKYVRPYYEKQKYSTSERDRMNAMLFGGTGGNLFSKIDQQEPLIRRAGEAFQKTRGLDQALDLAKDTATGAEKDFGAAWTDFKTQFGNSMLPQVTEILRTGTEVLRAIAAFANSDAGKAIQSMGSMITGAAAWPWHLIGSMFGGDKQATPDPTVPKKDASTGNVHTTINLDGRKIAQAVTPYMAGALGSGMYGLGVDPTVAVPMPGIKGG